MRSLARAKGPVSPISEQQDIHLAAVKISAVFEQNEKGFTQGIIGTVPPTGTFIFPVRESLLDVLLKSYKDQIFYLGRVWGSTVKLPLWFKHFGEGPRGAKEAYHIGIFGKTGSGKSVLAKMILLAYARHKEMGIIVLDPQGEFSKALKTELPRSEMENILSPSTLSAIQREYIVYDIDKIALNRWELLGLLLKEFKFFEELGIKGVPNQDTAMDYVINVLKPSSFADLSRDPQNALNSTLETLNKYSNHIYSGEKGAERLQENIEKYNKEDSIVKNNIDRIWNKVVALFSTSEGKKTPKDIIKEAIGGENRPIVIIDLSKTAGDITQAEWEEKIKPMIITLFIEEIIRTASYSYKEGKSLNTLIVIDEAHRLAPRGTIENEKKSKLRSLLIDGARTTRKYGLGWMFISQTLSSIDKEIISQLRIYFIGYGLSMGTELDSLKELVGGDQTSIKLYQSFPDPQSAFESTSRQYSFMTIGPVSPLSFTGSPLFLTAFTDPEEFLKSNNIRELKTRGNGTL
ncbi:MAG: ATP-binding protein, partial [Candidatus Korarchaeota archaeon]